MDYFSLLLLPEVPPSLYTAFFTKPLRHALREAACQQVPRPVLDIAIALDPAHKATLNPRTKSHANLHDLLAATYKILGQLSFEHDDRGREIELTPPNGVDVRVFFVISPEKGADGTRTELDSTFPSQQSREHGPIIPLEGLAASRRSWHALFTPATPEGDWLWEQFASISQAVGAPQPKSAHQRVSTGASEDEIKACSDRTLYPHEVDDGDNERHYSIVVGGTFDHLHIGHKILLTATAMALDPSPSSTTNDAPRRLINVGVMDDSMLTSKEHHEFLQPWNVRAKAVLDFMLAVTDFLPFPATDKDTAAELIRATVNHSNIRVELSPDLVIEVVHLRDAFGPTLEDPDLSVVMVTQETSEGGQATNDMRSKKGWSMMKVLEVSVLKLIDMGKDEIASKVSSTAIRRRRMDS